MQEILLTTECVFLTLPCTDETALRGLNGYAATRTAHLFTYTQFRFVLKFKPAIVMYEMTPPKGDIHTSFHDMISRLEELGYSTDTALIDASMVGPRPHQSPSLVRSRRAQRTEHQGLPHPGFAPLATPGYFLSL